MAAYNMDTNSEDSPNPHSPSIQEGPMDIALQQSTQDEATRPKEQANPEEMREGEVSLNCVKPPSHEGATHEGPSTGTTDEVTSGEPIVRATSRAAAGVNSEVAVERASSPAERNSKKPPMSPQKVFSPPADRGKQLQNSMPCGLVSMLQI